MNSNSIMNQTIERERVSRDLTDAKCPPELVSECLGCLDGGAAAAMLPKLSSHRRYLVGRLHEYQDAIDCLDSLAHDLRRGREKS